MLDVAWPELFVIGAVAFVVVGPEDLPKVMHAIGKWAGKARNSFIEIRDGIDQLGEEAKRKSDREDRDAGA